jgi:alkylresorcinol/alkylpyrone synthase
VPRIIATATASPPHLLDRATLKAWARRLFPPRRAAALDRLADGTGIAQRRVSLPVEEIVRPRPFERRNAEYAGRALELAESAARGALARAQLDAAAIDLVVTTSCTGLLIPSLSAHLAPRLGLRADVARLPITELGCAAGAAALARARDHLLARPARAALVIAVELPSLTFQLGDGSMQNLVAGALFGDGAAAAVLADGARAPGPELVDARSHLWPDTTHLMGFRVADGGLHVVLDRDVPRFLAGRVRPLVDALLAAHGLLARDLAFAAIHPGGRRILDGLERDLALDARLTAPARHVLEQHGNMSSATVLFVLDEILRAPPPPTGSHGLLAAFGPGFAAELGLLRWEA